MKDTPLAPTPQYIHTAWNAGFTDLIPLIPVGGVLRGESTAPDGTHIPACDVPENQMGKVPGVLLASGVWETRSGWTDYQLNETDMRAYDAAGASCGLIGGPRWLTLDLDCLDQRLSDAWRQVILSKWPTIQYRVGKAPKFAIPFRVVGDAIKAMRITFIAEGQPKQLIEVLGKGRQSVLMGLHPATGQPYTWHQGSGVPGMPDRPIWPPSANLCPELDEGGVLALVEELEAVAVGLGWMRGQSSMSEGDRTQTARLADHPPDLGIARDIVRHIPNTGDYDDWVGTGMALKWDFGDAGWSLFEDWSSRWQSPDPNDAYDPSFTAKTWRSLKPNGSKTFGSVMQKLREAGVALPSDLQHGWDADMARRNIEYCAAAMPADVGPLPVPVAPMMTHQTVQTWWQDVDPVDVMQPMMAQPLPQHCVPAQIAPLMQMEAPAMGVPPEMLFAACMGAAAAAMDDRITIRPHEGRGWRERPCLWLAMVGGPSVKKTPAINLALGPVKAVDGTRFTEDLEAINEYGIALKRYNSELKRYTDGKEGAERPVGPEPEHPQTRRIRMDDSTVAKMSEVLKHNPRGITVYRDELSGLLATLDGRGDAAKDRADYLELYNGGSRLIERISRGSVYVPNWSASIVGGIQPEALRANMKNVPLDGLLQRFYPVVAQRAAKATNVPSRPGLLDSYGFIIRGLADLKPGEVKLTSEASEVMQELWNNIFDLVDGGNLSEAMASHLSKWEGGMYRWLLVVHAIHCVADNRSPFEVPVQQYVAQIVADLHMMYFLPNVQTLYDQILGGATDAEHIRWIAGYILSREEPCERFTLTMISRAYKNVFPKMEDVQKRRILRYLEDCGWIKAETDKFLPSGWSVNMNVHHKFVEQAKTERLRRQAIIRSLK